MASMLGSNRRRHTAPKLRPRRQSLQKPNGVIGPRVQKVGGERFAIVCIDPAKHRSEWMMADYFGNLRIEARTLQHQAPCFKLAMEQTHAGYQGAGPWARQHRVRLGRYGRINRRFCV